MILCMTAATVFFGVFAYLYLTAGEELSETLIASCMENAWIGCAIAERQSVYGQKKDKTGTETEKKAG